MKNEYIPYKVKILDIIKHTSKEWTFRVERKCGEINPGQFFEISIRSLRCKSEKIVIFVRFLW